MRALLTIAGLLATTASAAYVQSHACGAEPVDLPVDFLRANVTSFDDRTQRVSWNVGLLVKTEEECSQLAANVSASLKLSMLFDTTNREVDAAVICQPLPRPVLANSFLLVAYLEEDVGRLYPLASFHSEIRIAFVHNDTSICLEANLTPSLGSATLELIRWLPISIFLFVFAVGILRTRYDKPVRLSDAHEQDEEDDGQSSPVLPHVGDCLNYLQFVFLTGALSVRYPGFYQPAVGNLNWFSLLLTGPVTNGFVYPSVKDGIYEINGTYGGTFGLEIMHQIVGAPNTMATWLNMVISIGVIGIAAAVILEGFQLFFPQRGVTSEVARESSSWWSHLKYRLIRVLRLVFSYFTLPLVSISFYQFDNADTLPSYHTSFSTLLMVCVIVAFGWLLRQVPVRSLGMLVFDSKRYHYMSTKSTQDRYGNLFIMILFVLSFIRGVAIGGLQVAPVAQLAVLASAEIILLVCISGFQAYPMRSIATISSFLRFLTICLMVAFLPGLGASLNTQSLIGYIILGMHIIMLMCGFLLPAMYHACHLAARRRHAPETEQYGLHSLQRRGATSSTDVLHFPPASPSPYSPRASTTYSPRGPSFAGHRWSSPSLAVESQLQPRHYFRPPRPTSNASFRSDDSQFRNQKSSSSLRTTHSTSTSSGSATSNKRSLGAIVEPVADASSPSRSSASVPPSPGSPGPSSLSNRSSRDSQGRPLGPRWHDYSFREADLYYMAGQGLQEEDEHVEDEEEPTQQPNGWKSIRKVSSGLWSKVSNLTSPPPVGFQVIRPPRPPPPPGAQLPPQTENPEP